MLSGLASNGASGAPPRARRPALLACAAAIAAAALAAAGGAGGPQAEAAGAHGLAAGPAPGADAPLVLQYAGQERADGRVLYDGYAPLVHPSTLELSGYPAPGSGETANLTFAVTYMGGWGGDGGAAASWRPAGDHPPVRLDVTGREHSDLYRITDVVSNIGTAGPGVFEPYDHETEDTVAEPGRTYTVRAQIEFVVEGFVPVYALGLDGDIVTVDVAASEGKSMPYAAYLATGEDYLDHMLAEPGPVEARERPPDAGYLSDLEARHGGPLKGLLSPAAPSRGGSLAPLSESSMPTVFNATGNVTTVDFENNGTAPVHGIQVCAYDLTRGSLSAVIHTLLNTTAGGSACAYTDAGGQYLIPDIVGIDPHDATGADVVIAAFSRGYGGLMELVTYEDGEYYVYALYAEGVSPDYNGTVHASNIGIARDDYGMDGAARIISTLSDGLAFFEQHGHVPANLTVKWHHASGAQVFPDKATDGAAYLPDSAVMWLDGPSGRAVYGDSFDRRVILHELAHHVHVAHDPGLEYHCLPHWYTLKHDERCAWGEGWAQVVPHLVYDSAILLSGPTPAWRYNIEEGLFEHDTLPIVRHSDTFEASGRPIGDKVEGSVAAAMWDMADSANSTDRDEREVPGGFDGRDDVAAGRKAVVGVFLNGTYSTFADYYDRWEIDMRRHSAERVAVLHGMSFAIPNDMAYYGFAGELGGVFKWGLADLLFQPNYVDVSADGSTVAVTSYRGQGLQLINATAGGENLGLHAAYGYDHACTLEYDAAKCLLDDAARRSTDLGPGRFSSMDSVAFGRDSSLVLVSDGILDRVHALGSSGGVLDRFGSPGNEAGEFSTPDGIAFLSNGTTAAVADALNRRIQTFHIDDSGGAQYARQFGSYAPTEQIPYTSQQLAARPDGSLHAADYRLPRMWTFPPGLDTGTVMRIVDDRLWRLDSYGGYGGVAAGPNGLVYASNWLGYVRVYDPGSLSDASPDSMSQLDGRPLHTYSVQSNPDLIVDEFGSPGRHSWQLRLPHGVALGPPDNGTGDVRVYVADFNGVKIYEKDRDEPRVESVWAHTPDGNLTVGHTAEIAINFSERVTVMGTPTLELDAGAPGAGAVYVSGSGSRTLTFNYTVLAIDTSPRYLDYSGTDSLASPAPASAVVDGSGNAADLTLPARGTAGSLAANSAIWVDPSGASAPPLSIGRGPPVAAAEGEAVRFAVNVTGPAITGAVSYSLVGAPDGAAIDPANGTFSWTPSEGQDGMHVFAVNASSQGNSSIRTFRVLVAENNEPPRIGPIPDMSAAELSEIRFAVNATDVDLPVQRLEYGLEGGHPFGSTVLPNGTFVWTPSIYHGGETYAFNVSVSDGASTGNGDGNDRTGTSFVPFNVTVRHVPQDVSPITVVRVHSPLGGDYAEGDAVMIWVEFSAPVMVDGSPELSLDVGVASPAVAVYNGSAVDSRSAIFAYTVETGHHSHDLDYTGTDALSAAGATILASSGEDVVSLDLPEPGARGSLSHMSDVSVSAMGQPAPPAGAPQIRIGVIGDSDRGGTAEAARLAAAEFNADPHTTLDIVVTEYAVGANASTIEGALRAARANGTGPGMYVGPLDDETLHAAMPYADAGGIVLVSTASTAPSLAAGNDTVLRLAPGDALREVALAWLVVGSAPGSVHVVVDEVYNGTAGRAAGPPPPQGRLERGSGVTFANFISPRTTTVLASPGGQWAGAAESLAGAVGSSGAGTSAVVFFGPDSSLSEFAAHAGGHASLLSARWFAVGLSDPPAYLATDHAGLAFAARTGLSTVSWAIPANDVTARIDASLSTAGAVSGPRPYAAYDAVRLLGWAAEEAAGNATPAAVAAAVAGAAEPGTPLPPRARGGALGEIALDAAGDLRLPDMYDVWTVRDAGEGPAWNQTGAGTASGTPTCEVRLTSPALDFNVIPGRHSAPSMQTVINSGLMPIERVELSASPWRVDPDVAGAGAGTTLPATLAELSTGGPRGEYGVVSDGAVAAANVSVGESASAWFRINLTSHVEPPGSTMVQSTTYTVSCSAGGP